MSKLEATLVDLEKRADTVETDAAWDALEPKLTALRADLFEAEQRLDAALTTLDADRDKRGALARMNPFNTANRSATAERFAIEAEQIEHGHIRERLERLFERYWADKHRPHLRAWVRRAEKIQREVTGSWATKAAVVAGAVLADLEADDAIARAAELLRHPLADDPSVMIAVLLGGRPIDDAARFLAAVKQKNNAALGAAFLTGDRTVADATALYERLDDARYDASTTRAAMWSSRSFDEIEAVRFKVADRTDVVVVGAIVCGLDPETLVTRLHGLLGVEDDVAAYQLSSDRADDEAAGVDAMVRRAVRGDAAAEQTIRRAALASNQTSASAKAIVTQLEQQLLGTWKSEATIIAAALLTNANDHARRLLALR